MNDVDDLWYHHLHNDLSEVSNFVIDKETSFVSNVSDISAKFTLFSDN